MKVLLAYDGSECADAALAGLQRAGLPEEGEALVLTVGEQWDPILPGTGEGMAITGAEAFALTVKEARKSAATMLETARMLSKRGRDRLQTVLPGWKVRADAVRGMPHDQILEVAEQWKADLIVVGSHGRSAMGRFFFGSVSQKVVRYSPCSVRVTHRQDSTVLPVGDVDKARAPITVVVGVDGSDFAHAAIRAVAGRKWPGDTEVLAVAVMDVWLSATLPDFSEEDAASRLQDVAARAVEELREAGLRAVPVLRVGDPKRVLMQEAENYHADNLFIGARGMTLVDRFLLGSVSSAVASRAHCSVEVVRI